LVLGFKDNTKKDVCLTSQLLVNFHDTNGSARGEKRKEKKRNPIIAEYSKTHRGRALRVVRAAKIAFILDQILGRTRY
jgi:hypothetical protein